MSAIKRQKFFTWVHKWIGLAIGIQVTLWVASGLVMVLYDIETVRGEDRAERGYSGAISTQGIIPPGEILAAYQGEARSITLRPSAGRMLYRVEGGADGLCEQVERSVLPCHGSSIRPRTELRSSHQRILLACTQNCAPGRAAARCVRLVRSRMHHIVSAAGPVSPTRGSL